MGLSFSIEGTVFLVFCVFAIAAVGYLIGRITVKGVNLGTAGVFVAALLDSKTLLLAKRFFSCSFFIY